MLDLKKDIKTIKITADPNSYSTFLYGDAKIGKSTFIKNLYGKDALFLETEPRDQALVGANVAHVNNWIDFIEALTQLKSSKELHDRFKIIVVDTVDNLVRFAEDYAKEHFDEKELGEEVSYGKDYKFAKDLWNKYVTCIHSLGYTAVYIGHAQHNPIDIPADQASKDKIHGNVKEIRSGNQVYYECNQAQPDLPSKYWNPINKSVDQVLYLSSMFYKGKFIRVIHLRQSPQWKAGSTFPKIKPTILDDPKCYRKALKDAVNYYSKSDQTTAKYNKQPKQVDFDKLMNNAKKLGYKIVKNGKKSKLKKIVTDIFGPDQKLMDANKNQIQEVELAMDKMRKLVDK